MSTVENCKFCNVAAFKYVCPKCNALYCSLKCYRSTEHLNCSEEFYRKCVEDELATTVGNQQSNEEIKKIYEILQRANQHVDDDSLDSTGLAEDLDSDDESDSEEVCISERLDGVDINDCEEVWSHLTDDEKKDFQHRVDNGDIVRLLPQFQPWWSKKASKLVTTCTEDDAPTIPDNIPVFSSISSREPSSCIHNNLWNIVAAYACTAKFFNGEHLTNAWQATNYFLSLCANVYKGTNFEDAEQAMVAVQMDALEYHLPLPCEHFDQIQKDCRQIMLLTTNKLAALSDVLSLLKLAKNDKFGKEVKQEKDEFSQKFVEAVLVDLTKSKLNVIIKKIEFLLAFVKRGLQ